jgi:hypothetical protein
MTGTARIFAVHIGSLCYAFDKGAQKFDNAKLEDTEPDCLEYTGVLATSLEGEKASIALR